MASPKPWEPTEDERKRIRLYAGLGLTHEQIASLIGKSRDCLQKRARKELDDGRAETIAKVAGNLVQKALKGDTTSAIFYLKTQAGWREKHAVDHTSSDGSMTPISFDPANLSTDALREIMAALQKRK